MPTRVERPRDPRSPGRIGVKASGDGVKGKSSLLCLYLSAISSGRSVKSNGSSHAIAKVTAYSSSTRSPRVARRHAARAAAIAESSSSAAICRSAMPAAIPAVSARTSRFDGVRQMIKACPNSRAALSNVPAASTMSVRPRDGQTRSTAAATNSPIGTNSRKFETASVSENRARSMGSATQSRRAASSSDTGRKWKGNRLPHTAKATKAAAAQA